MNSSSFVSATHLPDHEWATIGDQLPGRYHPRQPKKMVLAASVCRSTPTNVNDVPTAARRPKAQ
jgi:hypothetical protein